MPENAAGMRIEPPWSPPIARSTSPAATRAALPLELPPVVRDGSQGLRTGPVTEVWLPPEKQRSSQTALPVIVAPASSRRVTTVASCEGTKPSTVCEPFIIGTPATSTLSLTATVPLASGPSAAPRISAVTYQAPSALSASAGRALGPVGGRLWRDRGVELLDRVVGAEEGRDERGVGGHLLGGGLHAVAGRERGHLVLVRRAYGHGGLQVSAAGLAAS